MINSILLNKNRRVDPIPDNERKVTTPERVASKETKEFEETTKKLQELKGLVPRKSKE